MINGETVTDGSGWTQTQAYDGFGNLTGRTGTGSAQGTTISTPANASTNQLSGYSYDANGNQISSGYTYDAENRIQFSNNGGVQYFYDGQNKRVWQATCNPNNGSCVPGNWTLATETITLFGPDGKQLASYGAAIQGTTVVFGMAAERAYFGGRLVAQLNPSFGYLTAAVQDRLGSIGKYYPYGEDRSGQPGTDTVRFATYTRDSTTGNDYADQRYYSSSFGRFMTPDPYRGSVDSKQPQSLNHYAYVWGDPVNSNDPTGLCIINGEDFPDPCFSSTTGYGGSYGAFLSGGGSSTGGHASIAPDDPSPLNLGQLRSYGLALRAQVNAGRIRDCDALADFATAAGTGATANQLEKDFGLLVPTDWRTTFAGIPSSNSSVGFVSPTSAFLPQYQNTNGDPTDQTHHFAAFLELGFQLGLNAATAIANALETYEGIGDPLGFNQGDVNLAIAAASLGAQLKSGTILPDELGAIIQDTICSQ